jgi:hypothetical protein
MLKSLLNYVVVVYAAGTIVACDQIPVGEQTTDDGSSTAATGGTGFTGGMAQMGQGVPADALTSILGLWRGECTSKTDSDGSEESSTQQDATTIPTTQDPTVATTVSPLALLGGDQGSEEYSREEIRFTREGAVQREIMYSAEGCDDAHKMIEFGMHLNYKVGKEVTGVAGARDLDFKLVDGEITLHDTDIIAMFNEFGGCGKSDWVQGEPAHMKDLDMMLCDGPKGDDDSATQDPAATDTTTDLTAVDPTATADTSASAQTGSTTQSGQDSSQGDKGPPEVGETMFEIYKVDGTKIYFGSKDSDADRPTELDKENYLTKVQE